MIKLLYIDLFCGAGGTSTGVEEARLHGEKCAKVVACVNHDPNAITSHQANYPDTLHFTEDIRTLDLSPLVKHLQDTKDRYPDARVVLWASLECTNFSRAKGGKPRDADSRTLAEHLFRYIEAIRPDYIQTENVEEFMCWGELDDDGKPVSKHNGSCYLRWVNRICDCGYHFDYRILNAADYGAYTSRKRFFGQFARIGLPISFPRQTYTRKPFSHSLQQQELFSGIYKPWRPMREVLDLNDEGKSIFDRKKPLCEATLLRIFAGLVKFIAGGKEAFLVKYNSMNRQGHYTAPSIDHHAFVTAYYGNGHNHSIETPSPTLTTKDRLALVKYHFLANEYSGGGQTTNIDDVCPAVLTTPKQKLVTCFLINPQFKSDGASIDNPCFTLIARMDKRPPYIVQTKQGFGVAVLPTDSPATIKIKEFMAMYGIIDIKMRMLNIQELKRIMGFPEDYVLIGTQSEKKKYIGNAVEVNMSRALCEVLAETMK